MQPFRLSSKDKKFIPLTVNIATLLDIMYKTVDEVERAAPENKIELYSSVRKRIDIAQTAFNELQHVFAEAVNPMTELEENLSSDFSQVLAEISKRIKGVKQLKKFIKVVKQAFPDLTCINENPLPPEEYKK